MNYVILLSLCLSRGNSFQTLVQHHGITSHSARTTADLSRHRDGGRHHQYHPLGSSWGYSSKSVLQMGIVEDFLSGADASQREVDNNKYIAELQQRVTRINALEATIEDLGDDELEQKTMEFKNRIQQKGESINGPLLEEAFAVVREAAWYVYD